MRDQMEAGMTEATRLTREGRLAEATAVIQRALGGTFAKASPVGPGSADRPVEVFSRVVEEAPQPTAPSGPGRKEHAPRQAPRPPRHFRGAPPRSGTFPGTRPGPGRDATPPDTVSTAGQFVERSYSGQAGARGYKLYIPSGYTGQAVPLVVMLHGCTQNPDDLAAGTRMNTLAEVHTFLVAYPAQAAGAN